MDDITIAKAAKLKPIEKIASALGIKKDSIEMYGKYAAKIKTPSDSGKKGKLILVTAVNPTPYGEGKTTISIGLADGMHLLRKKVCLALREPSLGPVFGIKGGAAGGGYAQVAPMEDINLHFTGDFHAITSANNLLSALIDNHIKQGNELGIEEVVWKRTMDMNDRALRVIECGLGGPINGIPRVDGFNITAASEIMAIFCLATDINDLKKRLGSIIIGYNGKGDAVCARDIKAEEAMTILLSKAIFPNLVQTLGGAPAFVHGGPFANIAHGCNSVIATKTALSLADYVVTEAGFGAELGAEKFFDIKCRTSGLRPDATVLVVTARALKYNGGAAKDEVLKRNTKALSAGLCNMVGHIENLKKFGVPVVVAINRFTEDTKAEINLIKKTAQENGVTAIVAEAWAKGGKGCKELAKEVVSAAESGKAKLALMYGDEDLPRTKIEKVAKRIYGAGNVVFSETAEKQLEDISRLGFGGYPVCIAKTQYSFSADPTLLGCPRGFEFFVREVKISGGAGFLVAVCGDIMLMPGLPKVPNSEKMTISDKFEISGLF